MTLPFTSTGPDDAPAILLLHGFMGQASDWDEVANRLAGFRCVAVDLPGHGEALELPEAAFSMEGTTGALLDTLDDMGIQRPRVVGYSMGGRLALHLALRHPGRCARLVLESASPGLKTEAERTERRTLDADRAAEIQRDLPDFLDRWYRMPLFASLDGHPGLREAFVAKRLRNRPEGLVRSLRGLGTGAQSSLWDDLAELSVPTLAVAGGRDRKFVDLAFEMAAAAPPLVPLVVPAGHTVHAEQPDLFAALVRNFFRDPVAEPQPALT
jgi:2-succinyl-6-hydroxy-2,4-cyclohexadiene-1-carboxylate synthase